MDNYIQEAARTKSPNFYSDDISVETVVGALRDFIRAGNVLDKLKKSLFYGKPYEEQQFASYDGIRNEMMMTIFPELKQDEVDTIHGILGIATESTELVEALVKWLEGAPLDSVNIAEENGDIMWYQALLLAIAGRTFSTEQVRNIAKLRARFPDKYSDDAANNRDLDTERKVLETN
jgi:NTP pyrophosphatase (non-canonical NTP hydrolase)